MNRRDPADPAWRATALHEAAHALVAIHYRVPFRRVTLHHQRPGVRGALVGLVDRPHPLADAAIALAGPAAGIVLAPCADTAAYLAGPCHSDVEHATRAAVNAGLDPAPLLAAIAAHTANLVRDRATEIHTTADALLDHPDQELGYRDVVGVLQDLETLELQQLIANMRESIATQEVSDAQPHAA